MFCYTYNVHWRRFPCVDRSEPQWMCNPGDDCHAGFFKSSMMGHPSCECTLIIQCNYGVIPEGLTYTFRVSCSWAQVLVRPNHSIIASLFYYKLINTKSKIGEHLTLMQYNLFHSFNSGFFGCLGVVVVGWGFLGGCSWWWWSFGMVVFWGEGVFR